jgi:activator of 2-hydroxyglutaryl-CoA dehydratase
MGGEDSKLIFLEENEVKEGMKLADFTMNSLCAAGTGSFLDQQARRLKIPIEEFGGLAIQSDEPVSIAGRCTVFAESDMIHKTQLGHAIPDIIRGLCEALVRNYLNNVGKGKEILEPIMFQGGVAANIGIREAFKRSLEKEIYIPKHFDVMGAIGAAILAQEEMEINPRLSEFYGWDIPDMHFESKGFECKDCPNQCEVVEIKQNSILIARWGSRCGKWDDLSVIREPVQISTSSQ